MPAQRAAPDIGVNIFGLGEAKFLRHIVHRLVVQFRALVGENLFENFAPEADMLVALGMAQKAPDLGTRAARHHELFQSGDGVCSLVAMISTWSPLRSTVGAAHAAIDLGADGGVAQIGMHRIGEVDRRRAARQEMRLPLA